MESLKGRLLIAGPGLFDPNFRRTLVLIAEHTDEGALGVVLNRPTGVLAADAVPALAGVVGSDEPLCAGGPVEPQAAVILAEFDRPDSAEVLVFGSIGFLIGELGPDSLDGIRRARVFAGYAGWGPGQLEAEMELGGWIVEPALPEDLFTADPEGLWARVLRRKGGTFAMMALMPVDPSMN
jgi:putative transcriptional regulator